jgi:hypothetical protein
MDQARRDEILAAVAARLEELSESEVLPEGFPFNEGDDERFPDLLSVFTTWQSLAGEIRAQGKQFAKWSDELKRLNDRQDAIPVPLVPLVPPVVARPLAASQNDPDKIQAARQCAQDEILQEIVTLHDRFHRLYDSALRQLDKRGWLELWFGGAAVQEAMVEGLKIALLSYDDLLKKHGLTRFGSENDPFDPNCMRAVDAVSARDTPPGLVVGLVRYGYRRDGKVYRFAEVLVSR